MWLRGYRNNGLQLLLENSFQEYSAGKLHYSWSSADYNLQLSTIALYIVFPKN